MKWHARDRMPAMSFPEDFRAHALALEGAWLDHAWDMEGDVFKTATGKIFLICAGYEGLLSATMKLTPAEVSAALTLPFVREATWPRGWITAALSTEVERDIALQWVTPSYELVSRSRGPAARG